MDSTRKVYQEFLQYLRENYPNYSVLPLLPTLEIYGIISGDERAAITKSCGPTKQAITLFLHIMPGKDIDVHRNLIKIFERNQNTCLSKFLSDRIDQYIFSIYSQRNQSNDTPLPAQVSSSQAGPSSNASQPNMVNTTIPTSKEITTRQNSNDRLQCVVCMEAEKTIMVEDCHHLCMCKKCSLAIGNRCPICRKTIVRLTDVYL